MEKENLTRNRLLCCLGLKLIVSILIAIPLIGMLKMSSQVLAEIELLDPVELYKSDPYSMQFYKWSLIVAICATFTPFKRISALGTGLAIGCLVFYGLGKQHEMEMFAEFSKEPLTELITLTNEGEWLIRWCVMAIVVQVICALTSPCLRLWKWRKSQVKSPTQAD